jgi:PAS domain S-box-containing protein
MDRPSLANPPDEAVLRILLENMPGIVWTTDRELRCTSIFGAGLAAMKVTSEQVVGKTPLEFSPTGDKDASVILAHRRAIQGETVVYEQAWYDHVVRGTVRPLRDDMGQITGCLGICQEVTAEAALRTSEERYRAIVEETTELISRFTPEGILTYVNDAYCRFLGVPREQILGASLLQYVTEEHQALTRARLAQLNAASPICHNEERMVTRSGEVRWIHWVNRALFDAAGRIIEIQSAGRDITERKEAERRIRREQENLKQLLNLYDRDRQLISYEIHDGLAQHLAGAMAQFEVYRASRNTATETAERAFTLGQVELAKGLRETRRLISDLRPPILDESGIVAAIELLTHEQSQQSGLRISFQHRVAFERLAPPLENAMYRVVQESVTNVIRHSQSKECWIRLEQRDDRVWLEIKDQGVGFDPVQPHQGRFGLIGLRERARLLGGRASIKSAPGQGTRVTIVLPLVLP